MTAPKLTQSFVQALADRWRAESVRCRGYAEEREDESWGWMADIYEECAVELEQLLTKAQTT